MSPDALRAALVTAGRQLHQSGLTSGTSGNLSVRAGTELLITPSAIPYHTMVADDIVVMAEDGTMAAGQRRPSSEWRLHLDLYRTRPDIGAVVHTHPPMGTTIACLGESIPAVHYMIAVTGGDSVRCAPYALFGTPELSRSAQDALGDRSACLLANHGMVTVGKDLDEALRITAETETLAGLYYRVRQLGGGRVLSQAEVAAAMEQFAGYGR